MSQPTAVILGASADRSKYGNKSVRAHVAAGYAVFPVNPKGGVIEGLRTCRTLADVPIEEVDVVSVYLPPAVGITLLSGIAALRPKQVWLNPGSADPDLLAEAQAIGLPVREGCSIVQLGMSPSDLP